MDAPGSVGACSTFGCVDTTPSDDFRADLVAYLRTADIVLEVIMLLHSLMWWHQQRYNTTAGHVVLPGVILRLLG